MICINEFFRSFEPWKGFLCDHIDALLCINSPTCLCCPKRGIRYDGKVLI